MLCGYRVERRKFKRLKVQLSVLFRVMWPWAVLEETAGADFEGETVDLSAMGMSIVTERTLPIGTKIFSKVIIFESGHPGEANFYEVVVLYAQVKSVNVSDDGSYRLGLYFEEMDDFRRAKVRDLTNSSLHFESLHV